MGTHPIFESDFDCLTDCKSDLILGPCVPNCAFSGLKIYPGHGKCSIRNDGKQIRLLSSKCAALYHHKKGISEEAPRKRRVRRNVKAPKAVAGLSYTELLAKKQQKPEIRQKQRDNAIKAAKEKKKAADQAKAAARKAMPKVQSKAQAKMPKAPKNKGSGGKR